MTNFSARYIGYVGTRKGKPNSKAQKYTTKRLREYLAAGPKPAFLAMAELCAEGYGRDLIQRSANELAVVRTWGDMGIGRRIFWSLPVESPPPQVSRGFVPLPTRPPEPPRPVATADVPNGAVPIFVLYGYPAGGVSLNGA